MCNGTGAALATEAVICRKVGKEKDARMGRADEDRVYERKMG